MICIYAKLCFGGKVFMQNLNVDVTSACIAGLAMAISFFSYWESRKTRREQGQAFIFIDLMQMESRLYVIVNNIGNTFAYDVEITVSERFVNHFSNLKLIQPGSLYRYPLIDSQKAGDYPPEVIFSISYKDRYSKRKDIRKEFSFMLVDYLMYDVSYNEVLVGYDISKTY